MPRWNGVIVSGNSNSPGRNATERKFITWARRQGYFVLGRGWPDFCLLRLKGKKRKGVPFDHLELSDLDEIIFIEVKPPKGVLSRSQRVLALILQKAGTMKLSVGGGAPIPWLTQVGSRR